MISLKRAAERGGMIPTITAIVLSAFSPKVRSEISCSSSFTV